MAVMDRIGRIPTTHSLLTSKESVVNSTTITETQKMRALPWLIAVISANGVFSGLTLFGPMFPLYMDRVGLDKARIGGLLAMIPLFNVLGLFVAPLNAKIGLKRSHMLFMGLRKVVTLGLLLVPWIAHRYGLEMAFWIVAGVVVAFSIFRAMAETAYLPWFQSIVPESVRGRVLGRATFWCSGVTLLATFVASWILAGFSGDPLMGYQLVLLLAIMVGMASVVMQVWIPRESDIGQAGPIRRYIVDLKDALWDGNFLRTCLSLGLLTAVLLSAGGFLPLYLKEQIGLNPDSVVLSTLGLAVGGMLLSYFWGVAADRYGARPAFVTAMVASTAVMGLWLLLPLVGSVSALPVAVLIYVLMGAAMYSALMAGSRYFYEAVPAEKRNGYMAFHYACMGLLGGLSPLVVGASVDFMARSPSLAERVGGNLYLPALVGLVAALLVATLLACGVKSAGVMPAGQFAGVLLRGNPFLAVGSLLRYHRADQNARRVSQIEKLGRSQSPLGDIELAEALNDPSFNVRYEALHAIARGPCSAELVEAMVEILQTGEPELRASAAWALARTGSRQAIDQLRQTLKSDYALLRSRSARALGILGDAGSCPALRDRLDSDPDPAVRIACAAALGELRDTHVASQLMRMIDDQPNPIVRGELALAVAEIAGGEGRFVRLYKKLHLDPAVTAGTVLLDLQKKLHAGRYDKPIEEVFNQAADCFSRDQVPKASRLLGELCIARAGAKADNTLTELLILTGQKLQAAQQHPGPEWIALALHLLECSCRQ